MRLAVRTASGVILLAVLLVVLFLGVGFLAALVGLLIAIALYEYRLLWRGQGLQPSLLVMAPLAAFWLFRYAYPQIPVASVGLLAGALVGLTLSLGWQPSDRPVARWAVAMGGGGLARLPARLRSASLRGRRLPWARRGSGPAHGGDLDHG